MTTTRDLLTLPSLAEMKLIAGADGLSRTVTWPYVILCPPISEWVSGGEFLIYYGANMLVEQVELCSLVQEAADNDAAGILFLTGEHYILEQNLTDALKDLAGCLSLPVFSMTSRAYVNMITKDIIGLLQGRDRQQFEAGNFWYSLFFDTMDTDGSDTMSQALFLGYLPDKPYQVFILQFTNVEEYFQRLEASVGSAEMLEPRSGFFQTLAGKVEYLMRREALAGWHVARQNSSIFVFPAATQPQIAQAEQFLLETRRKLTAQYPGTAFHISAGQITRSLAGIRESFLQSKRCLMAQPLLPDKNPIIRYPDLGFYQLLFEIRNPEIPKGFAARLLGPLLANDAQTHTGLYETLDTFLACRCNKVQAAAKLFLHRNTLLARLDKIEALTGLSLESAEDLFLLQAAIHIQRYFSHI